MAHGWYDVCRLIALTLWLNQTNLNVFRPSVNINSDLSNVIKVPKGKWLVNNLNLNLSSYSAFSLIHMQFGNRLGTGMRQGTAQREVNYTGVGYNTKVNSVDRPVTNHGMVGMKAASLGPGRQIYDQNYYRNLLKNKNNEIADEIQKMK